MSWNNVVLYTDENCLALQGQQETEYLRRSLIEANSKVSELQTALDHAAEDYAALMVEYEDALMQIRILGLWKLLAKLYRARLEKAVRT